MFRHSGKTSKTMRAVLALVFVAGFIVAWKSTVASRNRDYPHFFKHRVQLRTSRDNRMNPRRYISSAIGFGKRDDPAEVPDLNGCERDQLSVLRNLPRVMSADALIRMMQTNPALADKLAQLLMQNDQSGQGD
ncbi:PREDICTED: uncharacterized protein LOC105451172 isoform X1 [Wasmannia auropunctata]|uniref:uncharacterized protein LOC105451172 isoform X1 n=2 Tax=Wasmannia auropunctata TaxID=64793 RepID=UPI0005F0499C|nr:PREDICTED: uncharacterized protein LOC105451172 isoform X1 [Wasmannia auropunctata]XP_011689757.1 PREDICTED: uncharacterized protein LOC105451172 isoform X1 [Wasmannia auropunctata]XP_011689758.1 PREDICTED: uncharacterized protein LOC105451172 isoform X1 [Wasmannia auropunctata]XP_011689759.1 PREDICTED: uncharacterized protein LOC105451172 isoform X1 [Wasmannia auropunctata]